MEHPLSICEELLLLSLDDEVFDLAIARFAKQPKPKVLKYWINQLAKDTGNI